MSIEIEVGLENAARVPRAKLEEPLAQEPKGFRNPKVQRLLMLGGVVALAVLVGLFLYYRNRESTDDAQVDGVDLPGPQRRDDSGAEAECDLRRDRRPTHAAPDARRGELARDRTIHSECTRTAGALISRCVNRANRAS